MPASKAEKSATETSCLPDILYIASPPSVDSRYYYVSRKDPISSTCHGQLITLKPAVELHRAPSFSFEFRAGSVRWPEATSAFLSAAPGATKPLRPLRLEYSPQRTQRFAENLVRERSCNYVA